jgi:lysylphosphatidylglycerol synthetase-like protein (DUF2156 family)
MKKILVYLGGIFSAIWGISHLFPTVNVVGGFGNISPDNVQINEGFTLIFVGLLVIIVTLISKGDNKVTKAVYILAFIMLIAMSVLSLFTGFKIDFLPFRLCPVIFTTSGLLILQGAFSGKLKEKIK